MCAPPHDSLVPCRVLLCSHCKLRQGSLARDQRSKQASLLVHSCPNDADCLRKKENLVCLKWAKQRWYENSECVTYQPWVLVKWHVWQKKTQSEMLQKWKPKADLHSLGVFPSCSSQTEAIWEPNNSGTANPAGRRWSQMPQVYLTFFSLCLDTAPTIVGGIWKRLNKRWSDLKT